MSTDLAGWLSAQYDRAEAAAKEAAERGEPGKYPRWLVDPVAGLDVLTDDGRLLVSETATVPAARFIADHDPQWRLRDIARKREILADCLEATRVSGATWVLADRTMRRLAAEFEREPGYLDEWRL